jgi:hypothetical protein
MRITSIRFLSLLIFCKLASAVIQAPPHASGQCAREDSECQRASLAKEQHDYAAVFSEERDLTDAPWLDLEAGLVRLDPGLSLYTNVIHCLDRFHTTSRFPNATEEDAFCMQLRKIGGNWWSSYDDFEMATKAKLRDDVA